MYTIVDAGFVNDKIEDSHEVFESCRQTKRRLE